MQTTAYLYAAASYLFLDHHLMCSVHQAMARFLRHDRRTSEEAYHLHQMLVVYNTIFGRYAMLLYSTSTPRVHEKTNKSTPHFFV